MIRVRVFRPQTLQGDWRCGVLLWACVGCASGAPNRLDAGQTPDIPPLDASAPDRDAMSGRDGGEPPPAMDEDAGVDDAGDTGAPPPDDDDAGGRDAAADTCADGSPAGDCGCPGEAGGSPAGAACDDGDCPLSAECDGDGTCGTVADCARPHASCGPMLMHAGHAYYVCPTLLNWAGARAACQINPHFDLIRIDDLAEQTFLETSVTSLTDDVWINATDMSMADSWAWMDDGTVFWMGTSAGAAVGGRFADWATGDPDGSGDCARHARAPDAAWRDSPCTEMRFFVCEAAPP